MPADAGRVGRISIHAPVKGATVGFDDGRFALAISIHAPVKGATRVFACWRITLDVISIHAPVKGATTGLGLLAAGSVHFNPRTREGCDSGDQIRWEIADGISIHAPVKGATILLAVLTYRGSISIHAPVKGATTELYTPRHSPQDFNPRTREGCDSMPSITPEEYWSISIHAPVKGATHTKRLKTLLQGISIHAPVKGATSCPQPRLPGR